MRKKSQNLEMQDQDFDIKSLLFRSKLKFWEKISKLLGLVKVLELKIDILHYKSKFSEKSVDFEMSKF